MERKICHREAHSAQRTNAARSEACGMGCPSGGIAPEDSRPATALRSPIKVRGFVQS
jgi:hypothetical protein